MVGANLNDLAIDGIYHASNLVNIGDLASFGYVDGGNDFIIEVKNVYPDLTLDNAYIRQTLFDIRSASIFTKMCIGHIWQPAERIH